MKNINKRNSFKYFSFILFIILFNIIEETNIIFTVPTGIIG
jgi:hypothetical protein